jgi:tetratricopeptide (TPR) repeat protein
MYALGVLLDQRGEPERAAELVERSLAVFRDQGDRERVGTALNSLGSIKRVLGDFDAARSLLEEGLAIRRELGDHARMASSLSNLGIVAFEQGDLDDAEGRFLEALELDRAHGNEWGAGAALDNLSAVAVERGDDERARELNREALISAQRVGDQELIAFGLEKAAVLAATESNAALAGRLAGAADAVREAAGIDRSDFDQEWLQRHLSRVVGDDFETNRAAGTAIDLENALRDAMDR